MKITFIIVFLFLVKIAIGNDRYYGTNSTEAKLKFSAKAEIYFEGELLDIDELNLKNSQEARLVEAEVYTQIQHLMGSFRAPQFTKTLGGSAVLGETFEIYYNSFKKISTDRALVEYIFDGKIVMDKRLFNENREIKVPVILPLAYDLIYEQSMSEDDEINHCTEEEHNSAEDFFYFWNPDQENCPLIGDTEKVVRAEGTATILTNTVLSYPEYHKLYLKEELNIAIFLGYIDDIESHNVPNKNDDAFLGFKRIEKNLKKMGYEVKDQKSQYQIFEDGEEGKGINFYRLLQKKVKNKLGKEQLVSIKLFMTDPDAASPDYTFWTLYQEEVVKSDILLYDGHSGLGGNLDLGNFPDLEFNKSKYQIIIFNGCSSYPYYNKTYFEAKGGSKNLDIITSGLPTYSDTISGNIMGFLHPFVRGNTESYQSYLDRVENTNGSNGTYLVGVNGDEDNSFKPIKH